MASIVSIIIMFLMACLWAPSALAVSLFLATDDTPGNPWIMGGGPHLEEKSPGLEIELYRRMAKGLNRDQKKRCVQNPPDPVDPVAHLNPDWLDPRKARVFGWSASANGDTIFTLDFHG